MKIIIDLATFKAFWTDETGRTLETKVEIVRSPYGEQLQVDLEKGEEN